MGKCIIARRGGGEKIIVQTPTVQTYTASGETVPVPNYNNFVILLRTFSTGQAYDYLRTGAVARVKGNCFKIYINTDGISVAATSFTGGTIDMGNHASNGDTYLIIGWN